MTLEFTEPLFLLSAQTGLSVAELQAQAAEGNPDVSGPQAVLKTGEPIPIVFCRRRALNGVQTGGAMIAPKASEGGFSNDVVVNKLETSGVWTGIAVEIEIYVKLLLVVSQGQIGAIQVRDIFYGNCRRGTYNQGYDARAGSWPPGNTIDDFIEAVIPRNSNGSFNISNLITDKLYRVSGGPFYGVFTRNAAGNTLNFIQAHKDHNMPTFCGTSAGYDDLTTLSFEITLDGTTDWNKQISAFVREGLQVTRLVGGGAGSSDNFVDLARYLMLQSGRLPSDLIDDPSLTIAANFTHANNFLFNGVVAKSENLSDWLQKTSYNFLLRLTNTNGKFGLRPRLPYNADYTIKTTAITPEFTFTEDHVLGGGFEIDFVSLEDREPVCVVAQWRQQPEADFGLVRTINVRYQGEAASGPFVSMDLSGYCVTENHAIKAATYKLATRKHVTHHLRLRVRERSYNSSLVVGDIVRVRLQRETSEGEIQHHDKVYEIARIEKTFGSLIKYDLTHFPIDNQGRSIVAKAVNDAVGAGNVINVGRSTHDCDTNSSTSTTVVGTTTSTQGNPPSSGDTEKDIPTPDANDQDSLYPSGTGLPGSPYPNGSFNPADPIDEPLANAATITGSNTGYGGSTATPGNTVEVPSTALACSNGRVCFYRLSKLTGVKTLVECKTEPVNGKFFMLITTADMDHAIIVEGECPDPSTDSGFAPAVQLGETAIVIPDPSQYSYARFTGTLVTYTGTPPVQTTSTVTTSWKTYDGTTADPYLTVGSALTAVGGFIYNIRVMDSYFSNPYNVNGLFAQWTPWVNYFDVVSGQHVGINNVISVPWRAHVSASARKFTGSAGLGIFLGDIAGPAYGLGNFPRAFPDFGHTPEFSVTLPADMTAGAAASLRTVSISGKWQFTNDNSHPTNKIVSAEWVGTDDNGDPYVESAN